MDKNEIIRRARLYDPHNFDTEFIKILGQRNCTQIEAYNATERLYKSIFGQTKYNSFESYYVARYRRMKSQTVKIRNI